MGKKLLFIIAVITATIGFSCQKRNPNFLELTDTNTKFQLTETQFVPEKRSDSISRTEITTIVSKKKPLPPEKFSNEELPKTYTSRKFIKGGAALTYDIFLLPGNIVRYDARDSNYIVVTPKSILRDNINPKVELLQNEILYSNKINNKASFNATALIAGLKVDAEQLMELVIQDISKSTAPDSLVDLEAIKAIANKIPSDIAGNYYFVKSSLLTFITFRKYSKADFSANVNTTYVTAEGKVYSSKDKFSKERIVSLDLISFPDLIISSRQNFRNKK